MRILIVDDHKIVRAGVRRLLEAENGFEVCGEAADGLDAIRQAEQLNPDAIVMDISMPHLNGVQATREICRLIPGIRVVVLSEHDSAEIMREALNAGAYGYVVKTAVSTDLVLALNRIHERMQ